MDSERIFIIGDIHGCLDILGRMIERIDWRPEKDRLIFLGDYIDRGESPKGVVDYILALSRSSNGVECLQGNHEAMFLDYLKGGRPAESLYIGNGGWNTIKSYLAESKDEVNIPADHMAFYESLKAYIELDEYYVVHAGFRPGVEIGQQTLRDMLWIRDPFLYSDYDFGKPVIFGHTPLMEPLIRKNMIGLDTAAAFGNKLTCLELPKMKFHYVTA